MIRQKELRGKDIINMVEHFMIDFIIDLIIDEILCKSVLQSKASLAFELIGSDRSSLR